MLPILIYPSPVIRAKKKPDCIVQQQNTPEDQHYIRPRETRLNRTMQVRLSDPLKTTFFLHGGRIASLFSTAPSKLMVLYCILYTILASKRGPPGRVGLGYPTFPMMHVKHIVSNHSAYGNFQSK